VCTAAHRRPLVAHPPCSAARPTVCGRCALALDEHRVLVEPACGAALAVLTAERYRPLFAQHASVVVVLCGGSGVSWEIMEAWRAQGLWG
jgi:threonine dehydratase